MIWPPPPPARGGGGGGAPNLIVISFFFTMRVETVARGTTPMELCFCTVLT